MAKRKSPSPWEDPSPVGRLAGTEGELQRLRGEHRSHSVADKTKELAQRARVVPSPRHEQADACKAGCWSMDRLRLEMRAKELESAMESSTVGERKRRALTPP